MSQFPGFAPITMNDDVGMSDADDDSSHSISRTAEHFGMALRISPPPLSIPNATTNYFAITAAYFPSALASSDTRMDSTSSTTTSAALPVTRTFPQTLPNAMSVPPTTNSFAAPAPPEPRGDTPRPKVPARNKVPLEKGYSQMVWLRLMQTEPDLAGLKGASRRRLITMDEIKKHKSVEEAWTVLRGRVYNISPYLKFHPGGVDMLMKAAGKDSTALFNKYHAWVNAEFLMEKCMVGLLDVEPQNDR